MNEIVPARQGKAAFVKAGEAITIINTHGTQVVDIRCFMTDNLAEFMSMEHHEVLLNQYFQLSVFRCIAIIAGHS